MFSDSEFEAAVQAVLAAWYDRLEPAFDAGALEELDLETGVLTLTAKSGNTYVVSRHGPTKQIWLASPRSGGLHFRYVGTQWQLPDGGTLDAILARELAAESVAV